MSRVILYDKDGTLLNFQKLWTPYARKSIDSFVERFDMENVREALSRDLGYVDGVIQANSTIAAGTGSQIHQVFESYHEGGGQWAKDFYEENIDLLYQDMALIDCAREVLVKGMNKGYKNVIVTSDSRDSTMRFIEKFQLDEYIYDVICGDDNDFKKPDYRVVKSFIDSHDFELSDYVMIGDNEADTLLGYDEGLFTIGVLSGTCSKEHLKGADMVIESVEDLFDQKGNFILDA